MSPWENALWQALGALTALAILLLWMWLSG